MCIGETFEQAMERAALLHVKAQLAYQRSPQARLDAIQDKAKRAELDRKNGHSPSCTLTKCAPGCQKRS